MLTAVQMLVVVGAVSSYSATACAGVEEAEGNSG